jgi:hypothetical protein
MRPLELNLASRPFRNNAPVWLGIVLAASAATAFTAWTVSTWLERRAEIASLEASLSGADRDTSDLGQRLQKAEEAIAEYDERALNRQAGLANEVLSRRGLSWTRLFNQLERLQPYEVKMVEIRPAYTVGDAIRGADKTTEFAGTVKIGVEGRAQSIEAFLEFQRALLLDRHFARVQPQRLDRKGGGAELEFELEFLYDPEGRLEGAEKLELPAVLPAVAEAEAEGVPPPGQDPAPEEKKP